MRVIWRITWCIVLLHKFTTGCSIENLRSNSHILLREGAKYSTISPNSFLNAMCITADNEIVDAKMKCSQQDQWEIPELCLQNCAPLAVPKHMKVEYSASGDGSYKTGMTATLSCSGTTFLMSGSDTLTCTSGGSWSGSIPQCIDYAERLVNHGENVILTCTSSTSHQCQLVNWFFEGTIVQPQSRNFQHLIVYRNTLEVMKVNELSIGRYFCTCISLESESAPIMTFDVNLAEKKPNSVVIMTNNNGAGGSPQKKSHERRKNRKPKQKPRPKHKKPMPALEILYE